MSIISANKLTLRIVNIILSLLLVSCNTQSTLIVTTTQPSPIPSLSAAPQILPTNTEQKITEPLENLCLETIPVQQILTSMEGILLMHSVKDNLRIPYLLDLSNNIKKELHFEPGTSQYDGIVSPNHKLIAMSVYATNPPFPKTKLIIFDSAGVIQKEWAWKSEWGGLATWSDNQHILIAKQSDLQLSTYNPQAIISVDVNSGGDVEINSAYPDYNQVNYVNWNLINFIYSPDFTRVLYPTSKVDPGYVNYVAMWDLEKKQIIATLPVELSETSQPEWSPDGTRLLISGLVSNPREKSSAWRGQELFTIDINGKTTQVTHFTDYYSDHITIDDYTWSPDGKNIAFWLETGRFQTPQLVTLNINSGKVINYCISGLPYKNTARPIWSPSGEFLALDYKKSSEDVSQVLIMNIFDAKIAHLAEGVIVEGWLVAPSK